MDWTWEIALDAEEVHALLCACDARQAAATGTTVPARNPATTRRRVGDGCVHLLRHRGEAVATFTLSPDSPSDDADAFYGGARRPLYLSRTAVHPLHLQNGSLAGVRAVRRAIELAREAGADALRAEANPDIVGTRRLLELLGFEQRGAIDGPLGARRVHLELRLDAAPRP